MINIFAGAVMLIVAYAYFREGIVTALCMLINVVLAGLVAFNFWEPLADLLDPPLQGSFLAGTEDLFALVFLFGLTLGLLRMATNNLTSAQIEFIPQVQQFGAAFLGLLTGYLVSGFLLCVFQTLPWHERFLGFEPRAKDEPGLRSIFPPDRAWLAMMRHAGAYPLANRADEVDAESPYDRFITFDQEGTFELRYQRYRRYGDNRDPVTYSGELDQDLHRK